jgi:nicotinamide-nucleotide adenylyltransferase
MITRIGMIARWKPVHIGHALILNALCATAQHAFIGIGSSNRYNMRNPFTFEETCDMIRLVLDKHNYTLIPVPDLDDGPRWREMVIELMGELDQFVTDNPYVASLLKVRYRVTRPIQLIPPEHWVKVDGTMVRHAIARCEDWEMLVPPKVADYIKVNKLDSRFRSEFGLETIAQTATQT